MRAGRGIVHSERTISRAATTAPVRYPDRMALPAEQEEGEPAFCTAPRAAHRPRRRWWARLIADGLHGPSLLATASETLYADLAAPGGRPGADRRGLRGTRLYTVAGTIEVGATRSSPAALVLRPGDAITVTAAMSDARVMLFGGAPMEGPRYIWWNFVSSRPERIAAAKEEWCARPLRYRARRRGSSSPCPTRRTPPQRAEEACTIPAYRARRLPALRTLQGGLNMSRAIPAFINVTAISGSTRRTSTSMSERCGSG